MNWLAAALAGIGAGIVATVVQLGLWWTASLPVPYMLMRDTRLAAAIVMGRSALSPSASFAWDAMLVATLVHFALSAVYGLLLAPLISHATLQRAVLIGIIFGLALYVVNMYGFTLIFPWFDAARDWITVMAHVAFGMSAAVLYKWGKRLVR